MKQKLLIISLFAMCFMASWAAPVSKKSAQQTAQQFLQEQLAAQGSRRAPQMVIVNDALDAQESECIYVFNASDGQGFVVVSGDDRVAPVLGYSTTGNIDAEHMPANMRSWLEHYAQQIAMLQKYNFRAFPLGIKDCGEPLAPSLTCKWNQNPIYNDECPMVTLYADQAGTQRYVYKDAEGNPCTDPVRAVTGCVATAIAQVLYAHKYPAATTAEIPAQNKFYSSSAAAGGVLWNQFTDDAIPAGTTFDWDNMVDAYRYYYDGDITKPIVVTTTEEQNKAVAGLMHAVGAAVGMEYGTNMGVGSSAMPADIPGAAAKYLGLPNATICFQPFYKYQDWIQTLYDEIKVAKCTVFGGTSPGGGHAFVVDGYDKLDFFSLNWGWGGAGNGYFRICNLYPLPERMPLDYFNYSQTFIRGLYPDAPALEQELQVINFTTGKTTLRSNELDLFTLEDVSIKLKNAQSPDLEIELGITVEGTTAQGDTLMMTLPYEEGEYWQMPIDQSAYLHSDSLFIGIFPDGEYVCYPSFRTRDFTQWKPCNGSDECYLKLSVNGPIMTIQNVKGYELAVEQTDVQPDYMSSDEILVNAYVHVKSGSLHTFLSQMIAPLNGLGDIIEDQASLLSTDSYYYEAGATFGLLYDIPAGLKPGKYGLLLGDHNTGNFFRVVDILVKDIRVITDIDALRQTTTDGPAYNLSGQRVDDNYRGIVIREGKKMLRK